MILICVVLSVPAYFDELKLENPFNAHFLVIIFFLYHKIIILFSYIYPMLALVVLNVRLVNYLKVITSLVSILIFH